MAFDKDVRADIQAVAAELGVEPAALLAVAEVESGGRAYATVDGALVPLIRWEGHVFYRNLPADKVQAGVEAGLAHPRPGVIKNPRGQAARYEMLERAKLIDHDAAVMATSWGVGQVLGENWRDLGFDSPKALLDEAMDGVKGQVRLMHRFITFNGLADELMHHLWEGFARIYNGAGFRKNEYHAKLRKAYERIAGKPSPHTPHPAVLRVGARGAEVKRLQTALRKAGFFLTVDGDFGPATRRVVEAFQALEGLEPDGVVGARTWARLEARVKDG